MIDLRRASIPFQCLILQIRADMRMLAPTLGSLSAETMPHLHRFYLPSESLIEGEIALPDNEAHHALRVVRVKTGDHVAVFDGAGREGLGVVASTGKTNVAVSIETLRSQPKPERSVTLAQAWLNKSKSLESIIVRGTELGVERFIVFQAKHSERAANIPDKWLKLAVESCKQSGRLWLPEFAALGSLPEVLEREEARALIATTQLPGIPLRGAVAGEGDLMLIVGPEGDFTEAEVAAAIEGGAAPVSLGEATFRSEVAAGLGLALIQYELGYLGPLD